MSEFITWLSTPAGIELSHAVTVLLIALAGSITVRNHLKLREIEKNVNGHLRQHIDQVATKDPDVTDAR